MEKEKAVVWVFPIITCLCIFFGYFTIKYGKPVTGLTIGFIAGFAIAIITYLMYDFHKGDVTKGFTRGDCPPIKTFEDAIKVPYYFFYIWLSTIFIISGFFLYAMLIIGGIIFIIYLIIKMISSGL